eukprot:m.57266 g.57266  ORF g.57266 m.57266 type:complete len:432 (-) comp11093_c0_seq1:211-1506(-)
MYLLRSVTALVCVVQATTAFEHGFNTVGDMMQGWINFNLPDDILEFYAKTYPVVVASGLGPAKNASDPASYPLYSGAKKLRAMNPNIKILLYENIDWGPIDLGPAMLAKYPEMWLRDDNGKPIFIKQGATEIPRLDWRIQSARDFFVKMVTQIQDGLELFDGIFVDGAEPRIEGLPPPGYTMSQKSLDDLIVGKMILLQQAKDFFAESNGGEVIGNPTLEWGVIGYPSREATQFLPQTAHWQHLTGTYDEMFGAFATQQPNGQWNSSQMNITINAILNSSFHLNLSTSIRGYPGPCNIPLVPVESSSGAIVVPQWPKEWNDTMPTTIEGLRDAGERLLEQSLALFLIVANKNTWYNYAWFYQPTSGWYPCGDDPNSCIGPTTWYEEFSKPLGNPLGPPQSDGGYIWTRAFEHANASIDLRDRRLGKVNWLA